MEETDDRSAYLVASHLLGLGRTLLRVSRGGALLGLLIAFSHPMRLAGLFLFWALAEWVAARVALDAQLFQCASQDSRPLPTLDRLLEKECRPATKRVEGALRWLRMQGGLLGLICLYVLALAGVSGI